MAEMIHFIRQMQAYCQLEVIECSWKTLIDFLDKKEGDLDALIDAHRSYLDRMVKKVLLLSPKAGKEVYLVVCIYCFNFSKLFSGEYPQPGQRGVYHNTAISRSNSK
jgi:hypothetical protein